MIKVAILSDTHSDLEADVLASMQGCNEIWHAGDIGDESVLTKLMQIGKLRAVFGNIDDAQIRIQIPAIQLFSIENIRVLMTHIAGYPGTYNSTAKALIKEHRPDIFVCGHSHLLKIIRDPIHGHLHINPGAAGQHGFHAFRTIVRCTLHNGKISNMEVVELGKRGKINQPERQLE